jgi:energy-coupling factor transport system substrate-specific component
MSDDRVEVTTVNRLKPAVIVLIPLMVALNLVLGAIVSTLKLPIFLDSVGIILTGILAGPWAAALVGVATTLLGSTYMNFAYWAFSGTAIMIGLTAGSLAERGFFRRRSTGGLIAYTILAGLIITVVAALVSAPVKALVFGGVTASGSDALVVLFRHAGNSVMVSVLKGQFLSELADKIVATGLAVFLAQSLSGRTLTWFPGSTERIRSPA